MSSNQYTKERKEDKPVLAICYDFDKTLSPDDMQAQGYIQSVGYDVGEFWTESNGLASQNDMDQNLAYMLLMKKKAAGKLVFTRENLENYGAKVSLFPGVEDCFERMNILFHRLQSEYGSEQIRYLSMGMSDDYPIALKHGSNMIRLGTVIFGKRNYNV